MNTEHKLADIRQIAITVSDVATSLPFYRDVLGLTFLFSPAPTLAFLAAGSVRINVQPGTTPLVLVLASYEPVNWLLKTNGRKISKILTSGYYDSIVMGADGTPVIKIGSHYAYKLDSNQYNQLKQGVALYVENPIQLFQGSYTGREFSVQ